jgi:hypothetical protein
MKLTTLILNSVFITSSIVGIASTASAEYLKSVISEADGTVYQIDLESRSEYTTDAGWKHVEFWLSTKGDVNKYRSTASCSPYQIKSDRYNFDWLPSGGGYPEGSVGGEIARIACGN